MLRKRLRKRHEAKKEKKHILFVCTSNTHRSPTAEFLFADNPKYEAKSAGVSILSKNQVTRELVEWADIIFVMDEKTEGQKSYLLKNFPLSNLEEKIVVLNIPDRYLFGSEELVRILLKKLKKYL